MKYFNTVNRRALKEEQIFPDSFISFLFLAPILLNKHKQGKQISIIYWNVN